MRQPHPCLRRWLVVSLTLPVWALVSCSTSTPRSQVVTEPPTSDSAPPPSATPLEKPSSSPTTARSTIADGPANVGLNQLWAELKQTVAVADAAVESETNRCLEGSGFVYQSSPWPIEFRTGAISVPWRFSADVESETPSAATATSSPEDDLLDPDFEKLLYGNVVGEWQRDLGDTPAAFSQAVGGDIYDGCLPTAELKIVGGGEQDRSYQLVDFAYLLSGIESLATRGVVTNEEYRRARELWQACVEELGYSIVRFEPDDTVLTQPQPLTVAEITAANECSEQVGMAATGDELLSAEMESVWESQLGLIEEFRTRLDEIEARALAE